MRPAQYKKVNQLADAIIAAGGVDHRYKAIWIPHGTLLRCSCGWRGQVSCRNAMGRKSKEFAAFRRHILEQAKRFNIPT
jgi:hypothetical protein